LGAARHQHDPRTAPCEGVRGSRADAASSASDDGSPTCVFTLSHANMIPAGPAPAQPSS
jgi:hypothetical protein